MPENSDQSQRRRVVVQGLAPRKSAPGSTSSSTPPPSNIPFRVGHGYDIHRLQSGGKLFLGGVCVSDQISPIAHSDGDVAIHALIDAILGAMAWGDIGEMFSDKDPAFKGASGEFLLQTVCDRLREAKHRVISADITILLEKPKISSFKMQMRQTLRALLGAAAAVNVKAATNEGCDAVGRGEAVVAHAVVLLAPEG